MKYVLQLCLAVVLASAGATGVQAADVTPANLEVNLGVIALDFYDGCMTNSETNSCSFIDYINGLPWFPGSPGASNIWVLHDPNCGPGSVYRQCIQNELAAYAAQGVVGVRFQFGMNGCCAGSTPFLDQATHQAPKSGAPNTGWQNNLLLFFQDLRAANMQYVSFTPDMNGGLGNAETATEAIWYCGSGYFFQPCPSGTTTPDIVFFPWLPWGVVYNSSTAYDPTGGYEPFADPDGYDNDPYLSQGAWGWGPGSPFVAFLDAILLRAKQANLTVREVDLVPETRVSWYPVMGRLIYDNTTNTPVLEALGQPRLTNGSTSAPVIVSSAAANPVSGLGIDYQNGCTTDYPHSSSTKDSALLIDASEILAVETGAWFGVPENSSYPANSNHQCGAITYGVSHAPVLAQAMPAAQDIHSYPCTLPSYDQTHCDGNDTTSAAQTIFTKMGQFITNNGLGSSTFIVGETDSSSTLSTQQTVSTTSAAEDGSGFQASGLASSNVVLRPWEDVVFRPPEPMLNTPAALSGELGSNLPFNVGSCTYQLYAAGNLLPAGGSLNLSPNGGAESISVTTPQNCAWSVGPTPQPPDGSNSYTTWFTSSSPVWHQGSGTASFIYAANGSTSPQTPFYLTIAGQQITVNQAGALLPPTLWSPGYNTSNVPVRPTLTWYAVVNATGYQVYLGTSTNNLTLVASLPAGTTSYTSARLLYSTTYYWYVVATDSSNDMADSLISPFTTRSAPRMPGTQVGLVRNYGSNTYAFNFDSNGNEIGPAPNDPADRVDSFAPPGGVLAGDQPVVGDWTGDGQWKAGWFRAATGQWWLDWNNDGTYDFGDKAYSGFGGPGDIAVIGDWAGLGYSAIGIFHGNFEWVLDLNANGIFEQPTCPGTYPSACTGPITGDAVFALGGGNDVPAVGNWNQAVSAGGYPMSQAGVVRTYCNPGCSGGPFLWLTDGAVPGTWGNVTPQSAHGFGNLPGIAFGGDATDKPVTGDWNNTGVYQFGFVRAGFLWNLDGAVPTQPQYSHFIGFDFAYGGAAGDQWITGKW